MRSRIRALVAFTGMIVSMSLSAAVMARAQAPAGPNRPAQVPEEYIVTPFGYFHPSCVVHLAKGEELLEGGQVIQKADGTIYPVPVCEYPHYTARGDMFAAGSPIKPPTISHSWIVSASTTTNTSYGEIVADWNVPSAPQSYDGQTVYFFPGLEDNVHDVSILQPVLGWNSDFSRAWGIASWNCCPRGTADESSPVRVDTGDLIVGTVKSTCGSGTLSCPTWKITTQDESTGGSTTLSNTPSEGQTFNWAFGGALEAYSIVRCSDYPPNQYITFSPTLFDNNFNIIENPSWSLTDWASGLTPQCNYGGQVSASEVTLAFGGFTLTVFPTGNGLVTSTDGYINCPGTCTQSYQAGTQVTLNANPAWGWEVAGWGGACTGMGSCSVTMTQDQSVTATFAPLYTLTVSTSGQGTVTSTDGYINCPGTCSHTYLSNTPVTLNASPAPGWGFSGWSGACTGSGPCNLTITQNQSVAATFAPLYTLTVSTSGQGTVTSTDGYINCPGTCSHTYLSNTPVTLNASPAPGWSFSGWSGACTGSGPCNLAITHNQSVTATFTQNYYTLTVSISGDGTAISTDGFINCPGTCSHSYLSNTPVTLNASPAQGWSFSGWTGACNGIGSCNVNMPQNLAVTAVFVQPGNGLQFSPVASCRLVDTRPAYGGSGPIQGGTLENFAVPQLGGCNIPTTAAAYSLNVTVVPQGPLGYLTIWPTGEARPVVSLMNSLDGRIKANAAIVSAGANAAVSVYVTNTTNVVIDIDGYFNTPGADTLQFYALTPCRVLDTRKLNGPLGGPYLPSGQERDFPVLESACNIPSTAQAYSMNFTVVPYEGQVLGYLTVWAQGSPRPAVSTLNNLTATIVANAAIVPAGTAGGIAVYPSGNTQLVVDIDGYFAPAGQGGLSLYPAAPCRVIDTRKIGNGQPFTGTLSLPVDVVDSVCAPSSTAQAYVLNATVVPTGSLGYLTLWPDSEQRPGVSTLNAFDGAITSNMAIVPNIDGKTDAFASGTTQLILDISSYFAP